MGSAGLIRFLFLGEKVVARGEQAAAQALVGQVEH